MPKGDPFRAALSSFSSLDRKVGGVDAVARIYGEARTEFLLLMKHRIEHGRHWEMSVELVQILMGKFSDALPHLKEKKRKRRQLIENSRQFTVLFERACREDARRRG